MPIVNLGNQPTHDIHQIIQTKETDNARNTKISRRICGINIQTKSRHIGVGKHAQIQEKHNGNHGFRNNINKQTG